MLRKIRIILALICFAAVTALFLDKTGIVREWFGWVAKIQFLPAVMALNVGVVAALVALTLLLGRVYCSVICPLGVMQDFISWCSGRRKKKKSRFAYSKEKRWIRYSVLVVFVVLMAVGAVQIAALVAPYSAYGRIVSNVFAPQSLPVFCVAVATLIIICVLAWRGGRTYCNTVCPVGTVLGLLSRVSLLKPVVNAGKCNKCGLCSRRCKASCIDSKHSKIDYSRCVACMDCVDTCRRGAITISAHPARKKKEQDCDKDRDSLRGFFTALFTAAGTIALAQTKKKVDGGLAVIEEKQRPERATAIVPPGAWSANHLARHCTACQLCVQSCPNDVLRPAADWQHLMQPEMTYENGYCRPECNSCSQVCPTGAIIPITPEDKSSTRIGHAVWVKKNCIPLTEGVNCGNCARHCPSGAIQMVPSDPENEDSVRIPVVNVERCIGCGACENLCPARPFSAIYVEGHRVHSVM